MPFRSVNKRGAPGYSPGWQRHHLLPRQLLSCQGLDRFFSALVPKGLGFENFGANGVLLPATERLALRHGLPLHRGPHRIYNELVLERVAAIEMSWSQSWKKGRTQGGPDKDRSARQRADAEALERMALLQRALKRRLLTSSGSPLILNRKDPIGSDVDFSHLDAMAEQLWRDTRPFC
ncbi:AHH domain-containing protein [Croceicoccus marinus]|uniref:AHH domain-containing protein n=1 Tax=Croceicoccus marinus TaxID=450378 RepID=A0A1Z1FAS4_9SPHN|nr:AHH domain-containing protein [Croceicoccus marinus]ARU15826.1 hypothetical protein A9D14_06045 [Croceicoccus marinus]